MFGVVSVRYGYAVGRLIRGPTGSLQDVEEAMRTKSGINARFGDLSCDGDTAVGILLHVYRNPRVLHQIGVAKTGLNRPSSFIAGVSSNRNGADQRHEDIPLAVHPGVGGEIRSTEDSDIQFIAGADEQPRRAVCCPGIPIRRLRIRSSPITQLGG